MLGLVSHGALLLMADQTSGDAAPEGIETKDLPGGFNPNTAVPAAVPFTDTTHLDREREQAAERDQEIGSRQGSQPTGKTETGGSTTTKKSTSGGSSSKSS